MAALTGEERAAMAVEVRSPAAGLAALAMALYRGSAQERVVLCCRDDGAGLPSGTLEVDLAGPVTPEHVVAEIESGLARLARADRVAEPVAPAPADAAINAWFRSRAVEAPPSKAETATSEGPDALILVDGADAALLVPAANPAAWSVEAEAVVFWDVTRRTAESARRHPRGPIRDLPLAEGEDPAPFWGEPRASLSAERLDLLIAEHARRTPDATAVSGNGSRITYAELNQRADALAARITARTRPGDVVGLLMHRSPQRVVAILAALKAGCAYCALSDDEPPSRMESLTADAGVTVVIADPDLSPKLPVGLAVLAPTAAGTAAPSDAGQPLRPHPGPDSVAYVSYTSGSSGEPKGVCVPHRAVCRLVRNPDWIDIRRDDVFFQISALSFDAATLEVFGALVNGLELVVMPPGRIDPAEAALVIRESGVTVLMLTTGLLHQMIASQLQAFAGVRHVVAGGEKASEQLVERLLTAHPGLLFTNGYGPTENTTFTTCWTSGTPVRGAVPIGAPISGTGVAVLDGLLGAVPTGVVGELYATGEGLALGYLGRPGATAERFVPHPDPCHPGERMYRTGDLVCRRADGDLHYVGRIDQQVKIQGFRVEPGEVEEALLRLTEVAGAAVVAQPTASGGHRLIAYIVPTDPMDPAGTARLGLRLREQLRELLPPYLVPWAIVPRSELALNRHGKVNRSALPAVIRRARECPAEYVAPEDGLESRLAEIWGTMLDVEPVGVTDDFFDLGGHSLIAAELLVNLADEFGVEISARTLYLQPTVRELAAALCPPGETKR